MAAAKKTTKRTKAAEATTPARRKAAAAGPATAKDVRDWARGKGLEVATRGRVHPEIVAAYNRGRKPERRFVQVWKRKAPDA